MTNTSSQKKESLLRSLAVAGLVAIIILIAWLSVQIVQVAPSAFSSLASLAEGLNQYEEEVIEENDSSQELSPTLSNSQVTAGDTTTLAIGDNYAIGTFTFMYQCTDSVTLIAVTEEGGRELRCDTTYNLDNPTVNLLIESTVNEDVSVPYVVSYYRPNDEEPFKTATGALAVKAAIEPEGEVAGETTPNESTETPVAITPTPAPEPTVSYTYQIPTSNPNGFVDLAAKYVGVGTEDGLTNSLEKDASGVFFFEVKNIGTKTSDAWRFTVALPNGGEYVSERQSPLKPNERAMLALTVTADDDSSHTFRVEVDTDEDRTATNNSFTQRVTLR